MDGMPYICCLLCGGPWQRLQGMLPPISEGENPQKECEQEVSPTRKVRVVEV